MGSIYDYFGSNIYPSDFQLPFVDHLHERPQPHKSLSQYLTHRKPNLQPPLCQPDVDIRDSPERYVIEIELPGISDKKNIKIEWTSARSLLIEGNIERPFVEDSPGEKPVNDTKLQKTGTREANGNWIPPKDTDPVKPTLVVNERRIGPFRRHFNFFQDVDTEHLKAKLENGLLMLTLPKKPFDAGIKNRKVSIE